MSNPPKQFFQVQINAPIETVWETLTKADEVLPFFFGNVLKTPGLEPGAPIRMRSPDGKYTGVVGDVVDFEPPHLYSHTFRFTNYDDPPCKVIYKLEEHDGGTQFTLITEDVPAGTKTEKQMAQGGDFITKTLKGMLENGKPPFSSRMILTIIKMTSFMAPKACLSENWP